MWQEQWSGSRGQSWTLKWTYLSLVSFQHTLPSSASQIDNSPGSMSNHNSSSSLYNDNKLSFVNYTTFSTSTSTPPFVGYSDYMGQAYDPVIPDVSPDSRLADLFDSFISYPSSPSPAPATPLPNASSSSDYTNGPHKTYSHIHTPISPFTTGATASTSSSTSSDTPTNATSSSATPTDISATPSSDLDQDEVKKAVDAKRNVKNRTELTKAFTEYKVVVGNMHRRLRISPGGGISWHRNRPSAVREGKQIRPLSFILMCS